MRWARWTDHLPLWVAWAATAATGLYEPREVAMMGAPLAAGALAEALRWDLSRHHLWLELGALAFFLIDFTRGQGLYTVAIHTLYVLAGARLLLPREPTHRRQLLLMSFLLFLTTAIGTTDVTFLLWTLAWFSGAILSLLQQSWEPSAALRRGTPSRPPYARTPLWLGGALLFAAGFFVVMPRVGLGFRAGLFLTASRGFGLAGLGDRVDLSGGGPIEPNPEVALRIQLPEGADPTKDPSWSRDLALLRGVTLEGVQGLRWEPLPGTARFRFASATEGPTRQAEFNFTPNLQGILALPTGVVHLAPPDLPIADGPGGSLRWRFVRARAKPIEVTWMPGTAPSAEPQLSPRRAALLTRLEPEQASARTASLSMAPAILPAPELAATLERHLQGFRYTLDNPSGQAPNPLEDFLERSQAGHCEYFASAMALMMRARGVPARVVNGYRLGPWIPEGGYFRVSQNDAHSWVEYWDNGRWFTADPTPRGPAAAGAGSRELRAYERWLDAVRYRWDRYVVRFSDDDQLTGLAWAQARLEGWHWRWRAPKRGALWLIGGLVAAWGAWRLRAWVRRPAQGPGRIALLIPLVRATRRSAPPRAGETARSWLRHLGGLRPERSQALLRLADAVEAQVYGPGDPSAAGLARAEADAWRGWSRKTPRP